MKLSVKVGTLNTIIIKVVIIANIFDAGGGLGLKYVSTACLLISLVLTYKNIIIKTKDFLFIILPLASFFYSVLICNIEPSVVLSALMFFLSVGFAIALRHDNESAEYWLKFYLDVMILYAVMIIAMFSVVYVLSAVGMGAFYYDLGYRLHLLRMGFFGYKYFGNMFLPVVYPSSSMFLVFATAIACYYQRLISATIIFIACFITGATGNVLFSLAIIIFFMCYFIKNTKRSKKKRQIILAMGASCVLLIILVIYNYQVVGNFIEDFLSDASMESGGSQTRIGHITSILDYMFSDIKYFMFGMGAGSSFYSIGSQRMMDNCEISPLEYWREFGSISFLIILIYLFTTIFRLYKRKNSSKILSIGLLMLFLCTCTNPQFMSPMFFITLFLCEALCDELGSKNAQLVKKKNNVKVIIERIT